MARREARPPAQRHVRLTPQREECVSCGERLWVAYHARRTLMTFRGLVHLTLVVRRCRNAECALYHVPYRAEEEGAWALPHGEFGLDIITVIGQLRYGEHRSIPEIHQRLVQQGVSIAQRTVTDLLERYEELVALHLADEERIMARLKQQGQVLLAIDGQQTIRQAVDRCLPGVPHQLCHFHYLDEAADPIFAADRHAKTELKKLVRGVRPIERSLEEGKDEQTEAMRSYCLAVRSALTDDGHPPLCASGLKLHDRLTQISDSAFTDRGKKGALPPALNELHRLLVRALKKTEALWPALEQAYALVHQAAHVLANHQDEKGQVVREHYTRVLDTMREQQASLGTLGEAIGTFLKVTERYWA